MRVICAIISAAIFLTSYSNVVATPIIDLALVDRAPTPVRASLPATTFYYASNGSRLATVKSGDDISPEIAALIPLAGDIVVTAAFNTAAKITELVCTKTGPYACLAIGIIAVLGIFFTVWNNNGKRDIDHVFSLDYPAVAGCGTRCRLETEAPEGDWRSIGNATINGVFHTIHYKRNGTLNGLRSVQYGSSEESVKRAEDDYGGVVVDYNWQSTSESAYDSFDSTSTIINEFGDDISTYMQESDDIQTCATFGDNTGFLDGGLISVGWNNQPFGFSSGEEQSMVDSCENI